MNDIEREISDKEKARKKKIKESPKAYRLVKTWDFGQLDVKEKTDKSRLMERKNAGQNKKSKRL